MGGPLECAPIESRAGFPLVDKPPTAEGAQGGDARHQSQCYVVVRNLHRVVDDGSPAALRDSAECHSCSTYADRVLATEAAKLGNS